MKIGIIIGSIRDGRRGESVGRWVQEAAATRNGAEYELIDLKEYDLPLLTASTLPAMAKKQYDSEQVTRWSRTIDGFDAYVFVTPEYNHGVPGAFKNAVDSLGPEWLGKAVAFVSYGSEGGLRSVEQWRQSLANFQMVDVRQQVSLSTFTEFAPDLTVAPNERRGGELQTLFDQLEAMARRLSA